MGSASARDAGEHSGQDRQEEEGDSKGDEAGEESAGLELWGVEEADELWRCGVCGERVLDLEAHLFVHGSVVGGEGVETKARQEAGDGEHGAEQGDVGEAAEDADACADLGVDGFPRLAAAVEREREKGGAEHPEQGEHAEARDAGREQVEHGADAGDFECGAKGDAPVEEPGAGRGEFAGGVGSTCQACLRLFRETQLGSAAVRAEGRRRLGGGEIAVAAMAGGLHLCFDATRVEGRGQARVYCRSSLLPLSSLP